MCQTNEEFYVLDFPSLLFKDSLDDPIVGMAYANNIPTVACSAEKVIKNLVSCGMGLHEAREYMDFNIEGLLSGNICL
jgi:hypothetical protein